MKANENKVTVIQSEALNKAQQLEERQALLNIFTKQADDNARIEFEKKKEAREKETFERRNGQKTSIYELKLLSEKILSELPVDHDPKFTGFFSALGRLENWSQETIREYRKPPIAAKIINETIYSRFGKDIVQYIHEKNPYVAYCIRKHKNYKFLVEEGITLLEGFISDAIRLMDESTSMYEFRVKLHNECGVPYQTNFFNQ